MGIPAPVLSPSLVYYGDLCAEHLSAALVQGQRDYFDVHIYRRVNCEGAFHTLWSGDHFEVEA